MDPAQQNQDPSIWDRLSSWLLMGGGPGAPADASLAGGAAAAVPGGLQALGNQMTSYGREHPQGMPNPSLFGDAGATVPPGDRGYAPTPMPDELQAHLFGAPSPWQMVPDSAGGPPTASLGGGAPPAPSGRSPRLASMTAGAPVTTGQARLKPLGDDDYARLAKGVQDAGLASVNDQKSGIEALKARAAQMEQNPYNVDLSPLLALGDAWTGGHTAGSYAHPETPEERQAKVQAMEEHLQTMRGAVSKDEIDMLKSRLGDQEHRDAASQHSDDLAQQRALAEREFGLKERDLNQRHSEQMDLKNRDALVKAQKAFNEDPAVKEANSRESELEIARREVDQALTDPGHTEAAKMALTKLFASRITREELRGMGGAQDMEDRVLQAFSTAGSGKLTPTNHRALTQIIDNVQSGINSTRAKQLKGHAEQYGDAMGMTPDQAALHIAPGAAQAAQASTGGVSADVATGAAAELERRKKANARASQ